MRIEVTQADIEKGEPCDPGCCPIALAINRIIPGSDCEIWYDVIDLGPGRVVRTPIRARQFLEAFDEDSPVRPFSFDLDIPEEPRA